MSIEYAVQIEQFAERHFIKSFKKKYMGAWGLTLIAIVEEFKNIDKLLLKNIAETISDDGNVRICKTEFKIANRQESRHGSGNRCIVAIHKDIAKVFVLFVYGKTDLTGHNETEEWKNIIRDNYPEYKKLCK
jgi:hypothetical protein